VGRGDIWPLEAMDGDGESDSLFPVAVSSFVSQPS